MAIDIKKIDDKIKKLEMIRLLASDPEMVEILEGVVTPNGTGPRTAPVESQETAAKPKRGEQTEAVREAVSGMMSARFTSADIVEAMERADFRFVAQSPTIAVNGVLRKLVKNGTLTVAVKGSGRAGNQYERV